MVLCLANQSHYRLIGYEFSNNKTIGVGLTSSHDNFLEKDFRKNIRIFHGNRYAMRAIYSQLSLFTSYLTETSALPLPLALFRQKLRSQKR